MKKTFIFGLIAAALGFTACSSEDDLNVNDNNQKKGMVLRATVEQPAESRATFTDVEGEEGVWQFAFDNGDEVSVTNTAISTYYTFTNDGTEFKCEDAKVAEGPVAWFAYFPSNEVSLVGQSGKKEDVANLYALAGESSATTGEEGLNITMSPKVAILVINNQKGSININVKNSADTWVKGLKANNDGFNVTTSATKQTLLSATTTGTYYVAVPAGVQLAVKDGDKVIKSTGTSGLQAGKYYYLTIAPAITGTAKATIGSEDVDVNWVQLWENGPKFAEYNVGVTDGKAESFGGYYCWGSNTNKDSNKAYTSGSDPLSGNTDTATNLWGNNWRMPTSAELSNKEGGLLHECDCVWTTNYNGTGKNGLLCTGKGAYSSNSVFLPAAGYCIGVNIYDQGDHGNYWSSTPGNNDRACRLSFDSGGQNVSNFAYRNNGYSVRAVLAE